MSSSFYDLECIIVIGRPRNLGMNSLCLRRFHEDDYRCFTRTSAL